MTNTQNEHHPKTFRYYQTMILGKYKWKTGKKTTHDNKFSELKE